MMPDSASYGSSSTVAYTAAAPFGMGYQHSQVAAKNADLSPPMGKKEDRLIKQRTFKRLQLPGQSQSDSAVQSMSKSVPNNLHLTSHSEPIMAPESHSKHDTFNLASFASHLENMMFQDSGCFTVSDYVPSSVVMSSTPPVPQLRLTNQRLNSTVSHADSLSAQFHLADDDSSDNLSVDETNTILEFEDGDDDISDCDLYDDVEADGASDLDKSMSVSDSAQTISDDTDQYCCSAAIDIAPGAEALLSDKDKTSSTESVQRKASVLKSYSYHEVESQLALIAPKIRKSVTFADDRGHRLRKVRVFHESSERPPVVINNLLRSLDNLRGIHYDHPPCNWAADFEQPVSDYVKFYHTVDKQGVSLENVLIRNDVPKLVGTVRVRNYCFAKKVFIRHSSDQWTSSSDTVAHHESGNHVFDIFRFELPLPRDDSDHEKFEFCCCFQTPEKEFWDSHNGRNYCLISGAIVAQRMARQRQDSVCSEAGYLGKHEGSLAMEAPPTPDVANLRLLDWGQFSATRNLDTSAPYY